MIRSPAKCFVSLGSNTGNRAKNLRRALAALRHLPLTRLGRAARIYETSPIGAGKQRKYLNLCAQIETRLSPMGLLIEFKRIEASMGRKPGRRWAPRPIDIDLLFYGRMKFRARHLTVPHAEALKRKFVLAPLSEIHPAANAQLRRLNAPSQNVKLFSTRHSREGGNPY